MGFPVLVRPAVFSFSDLLRQHPKHSFLSAVLWTERKATNAPIRRVYSILIKKDLLYAYSLLAWMSV